MATILIPDAHSYQAVSGIRSLTKNGDKCDLAWNFYRVKSSYIRKINFITASKQDNQKYISDIIELCKNRSYDFILPFGNSSHYSISKYSNILSSHNINFMVSDFEIFSTAHDKYKMIEFCRSIGISTPELFTNYSDNDVSAIANHLKYPVVIKAKSGSGVIKGLRYANNKEELIRSYNEIISFQAITKASNYESPMIQEFIPGFIHDACTLTYKGNIINILTQKRHIMYPIYGGIGAVTVTTHEPKLSNLARRILEALKWNGPAQIEFKYDNRDNTYKLIEMNPKFWGTLNLSIKVGMDFPLMIRNILMGEDVEVNKNYPSGVRYKLILPYATLACLQYIKEFGFKSVFDKNAYIKTYYDFDHSDIIFESYRVISALISVFIKRYKSPNSNISKDLINRI